MSEQQPSPQEGWYPVDELTERHWTGSEWGAATRPRQQPPAFRADDSTQGSSLLVTAGVVAVLLIGSVLSLQSASLLTGTGTIWTGVALTVGATVFAFILKARGWVKVVAALLMIVAVANALSVEASLEEIRQDIGRIGE